MLNNLTNIKIPLHNQPCNVRRYCYLYVDVLLSGVSHSQQSLFRLWLHTFYSLKFMQSSKLRNFCHCPEIRLDRNLRDRRHHVDGLWKGVLESSETDREDKCWGSQRKQHRLIPARASMAAGPCWSVSSPLSLHDSHGIDCTSCIQETVQGRGETWAGWIRVNVSCAVELREITNCYRRLEHFLHTWFCGLYVRAAPAHSEQFQFAFVFLF